MLQKGHPCHLRSCKNDRHSLPGHLRGGSKTEAKYTSSCHKCHCEIINQRSKASSKHSEEWMVPVSNWQTQSNSLGQCMCQEILACAPSWPKFGSSENWMRRSSSRLPFCGLLVRHWKAVQYRPQALWGHHVWCLASALRTNIILGLEVLHKHLSNEQQRSRIRLDPDPSSVTYQLC